MDTGTILVEPEAAASSSGAQRVAIYARVSSAENTCNLESQAERLAAYCAACGYQVADGRHINADVNGSYTLFCHVGMALCRSAAGNREIMDEVRVYVIRRPHGVVPEFLGPTPKMTKEGSDGSASKVPGICFILPFTVQNASAWAAIRSRVRRSWIHTRRRRRQMRGCIVLPGRVSGVASPVYARSENLLMDMGRDPC